MNGEFESKKNDINHEEILKQLINTAMTTRKTNTTFVENLPTSLTNNNVTTSLATLFGRLNNKQQYQTEKMPLVKRYKCSLCSHISAWGGREQSLKKINK